MFRTCAMFGPRVMAAKPARAAVRLRFDKKPFLSQLPVSSDMARVFDVRSCRCARVAVAVVGRPPSAFSCWAGGGVGTWGRRYAD